MKITLHATDALGRQLSVETTLAELDTTARDLGKIGATFGELLGSGLCLPYDNERDFDWALIGARQWTDLEGNVGVFWRGSFYKRREYEAKTTGIKMPAAIKYSRGARPTDPVGITEGDEVKYVTLILFKGGQRQNQWAKQGNSKAQPARPEQTAPPAAQQPQEAPTPSAKQEYARLTKGTRYWGKEGATSILIACENALGLPPHDSLNAALDGDNNDLKAMILNTARDWIAEDDKQAAAS